jgi:hypothetical protein
MPDRNHSDARLDERLKSVPIPDGLQDRAAVESLFDDASLDRLLGRVDLPAGLADRVRESVFAGGQGRIRGGIDLDRAPAVATAGAAATAPGESRWRRLAGQWTKPAVGHGNLVAVSLCLLLVAMFLVGREFSRRFEAADRTPIVIAQSDDPAAKRRDTPVGMLVDEFDPAAEPGQPLLPPVHVEPDETVAVVFPEAPFAEGKAADTAIAPDVRAAAVGVFSREEAKGMRVATVPDKAPRRLVPRLPGFNLAFEMAHGEAPFVDPATDPALAVDHPPLTMQTASFDAFCWAARTGVRPTTAGLRVEEILAAMPATGAIPAAAAGPQIEIHAVRSLRRQPESDLVEVCVTAPAMPRSGQPAEPLNLVIVIDQAAGAMPLVWPWTCRALESVAGQMTSADRVAVVVGGPRPRIAGTGLDAAAVRILSATLAVEPPSGAADFDATMRLVRRDFTRPEVVVVANVDSVDRARDEGRAAVASWRNSLASPAADAAEMRPPRFVIIDPSEPAGRQPAEPGFGRTPADACEIRRAVLAQVFGGSSLTARQCRLAVSFDPRTVASYRLVGHRQSAVESLANGTPAPIDMHAGETVRAVYEVVRRKAAGTLISASFFWRPIDSSAEQIVRGTLTTDAFTLQGGPPSPHGCELLLATGLGEWAGGSVHVGPRGPAWTALVDLAADWRSRGGLTAFATLLMDAMQVGDRTGAGKGAKQRAAGP